MKREFFMVPLVLLGVVAALTSEFGWTLKRSIGVVSAVYVLIFFVCVVINYRNKYLKGEID